MDTAFELSNGEIRMEIAPSVGGSVCGLWLGEMPILESTPASQLISARKSASYPLVPYSNRIANAEFQWNGRSYRLLKNFHPEPHAIHGVGWEQAWTVVQRGPSSASISLIHGASDSWPFDFDATQIFTLEPHALVMEMAITNRFRSEAPVGLGWHPFFVKRPGMHLRFAAAGRWEMDAGNLPTQHLPNPGLDTDLDQLKVDHCFDGWDGILTLIDPLMQIRVLAQTMNHLVVYTTPQRTNVALEPVSHANNALNLLATGKGSAEHLGVHILKPGQTFSSSMRIELERPA